MAKNTIFFISMSSVYTALNGGVAAAPSRSAPVSR
jgi:hypothetical protein